MIADSRFKVRSSVTPSGFFLTGQCLRYKNVSPSGFSAQAPEASHQSSGPTDKKEPRRGARIIIPTGRWQDKRRRRDITMKTRMRENEDSQVCVNITK